MTYLLLILLLVVGCEGSNNNQWICSPYGLSMDSEMGEELIYLDDNLNEEILDINNEPLIFNTFNECNGYCPDDSIGVTTMESDGFIEYYFLECVEYND